MTKTELRLRIEDVLRQFPNVQLIDEEGTFMACKSFAWYDVRLLRELGSGMVAFGAVALSFKTLSSGDLTPFLRKLSEEATRLESL